MKRRQFLKNSLAVSTLAGLGVTGRVLQAAPGQTQEYYHLRVYRQKKGADTKLLDSFLETAAIPALNRLGLKPVGVFAEREPKEGPDVFLLVPFPTLEAFSTTLPRLMGDQEFLQNGADYLQTAKENPAFERIDSWLLLAFEGMPRLELPAYSKDKKPRLFELRTYESYSEAKGQKKVEMFNSGEIDVMREVGLAPVFYGQALVGKDMPHLTYMLSAENQDAHKAHWATFGKHPVWNKMKNDPQYADTVSKISNWFLVPKSYSQI
jgi:hypothetical protein